MEMRQIRASKEAAKLGLEEALATSGLASLYSNGALIGSGLVGAGFSFETFTAGPNDGINGGGPFPDPSFNGSTDDLRIYSQALTASQVSALDASGPDATNAAISADIASVPEPSTWMMMLIGVGALLGLRRFRRSVV